MKSPYLLSVRTISGSSEIGFQIVGISPKAQTGPIVIDLAEISVERPVFLHHENNVVHALERAHWRSCRRWSGRRSGGGAEPRTSGKEKQQQKSKNTRERYSFAKGHLACLARRRFASVTRKKSSSSLHSAHVMCSFPYALAALVLPSFDIPSRCSDIEAF